MAMTRLPHSIAFCSFLFACLLFCPCLCDASSSICSGPLEDTLCNAEDVQKANVEQLNTILKELVNTTFFRLFRVNLERPCAFWSQKETQEMSSCSSPSPPPTASSTQSSPASFGGGIFGTGADEMDEEEEDPPLCSLQPFDAAQDALQPTTTTTTPSQRSAGDSRDVSDDLPPETSPAFPIEPTTDVVEDSLSWKEHVVIKDSFSQDSDEACDDENPFSNPTFWLDMCDSIPYGGSSQYVNLMKNIEGYTGYNGSKVWAAIYDENCLRRAQSVQDLCYEERVLYRLLSGMHASTNIHIAAHYHPPRKGIRTRYEPNLEYFARQVDGHEDRVANMHFAFVVLLRALNRASPFLRRLEFTTGVEEEERRTHMLMTRLVDSCYLQSCGAVFSAFDENNLFRAQRSDMAHALVHQDNSHIREAQLIGPKQFKGVFQNISVILDCVTCQKCQLHGKLNLLGLGTALKFLLVPEDMLEDAVRGRDEVVALINTLASFSEAILAVDRLQAMRSQAARVEDAKSLNQEISSDGTSSTSPSTSTSSSVISPSGLGEPKQVWPNERDKVIAMDRTLHALRNAHEMRIVSDDVEALAVSMALRGDPSVLLLGRHYGDKLDRFAVHVSNHIMSGVTLSATRRPPTHVVVVGGGLAGMTAALTLIQRGAHVTLVEKEAFLGGNSAWAATGINAAPVESDELDSSMQYLNDTLRSSKQLHDQYGLMATLTGNSAAAKAWLEQEVGLPLPLISQLGGHSAPRTYRPEKGFAGSAIVFRVQQRLKSMGTQTGRLTLLTRTRLRSLVVEEGGCVGIRYSTRGDDDGELKELRADVVVLATGGFAADGDSACDGNESHASGPPCDSLLRVHGGSIASLPTTNGAWAVGDGVRAASSAGASLVHMQHIQVHPTAFVDPNDADAPKKTLCAELLRGQGAILVHPETGRRVADELQTRDNVTAMLMSARPERPEFGIVLPVASAHAALNYIVQYEKKGLMARVQGVRGVARHLEGMPEEPFRHTMRAYNRAHAGLEPDEFGKRYMHARFPERHQEDDAEFFVGLVTPAVHNTMGGVQIDQHGRVMDAQGDVFRGLYAAGEVTGGVHGSNRLGGNALTDCVVFGRQVGLHVPVNAEAGASQTPPPREGSSAPATPHSPAAEVKAISVQEMSQHTSEESCWVAIDGDVYDFTSFLEEHPAGAQAILDYSGTDATDIFDAVHNRDMLDDFAPIGKLLHVE